MKSMTVLVWILNIVQTLFLYMKISEVCMIRKSYGTDSGRCGTFPTTAVVQKTTAFVTHGYFAGSLPDVSHHLSLMAIDHLVGILCEMPYVKHHYFSPPFCCCYTSVDCGRL